MTSRIAPPSAIQIHGTTPVRFPGLPGKLGELGPKAKPAIPGLIQAMLDGELNVRSYASAALSAIGKDAIPALKTVLNSKVPVQKEGAIDALIRRRGCPGHAQ